MNKRTFLKSVLVSVLSIPVLGLGKKQPKEIESVFQIEKTNDIYLIKARDLYGLGLTYEMQFYGEQPVKIGDQLFIYGPDDQRVTCEIFEYKKL